MKCFCEKELEYFSVSPDKIKTYKCPNDHGSVCMKNNEIISYNFIWDADVRARDRYRLSYSGDNTTISKQDTNSRGYYVGIYKTMISIPRKIELVTENDVVQIEKMIARLEQLKAFA
jgi:hypothetical protein